jgi:hypothetical protein
MRRRALLGGLGAFGLAGCLRLEGDSTATDGTEGTATETSTTTGQALTNPSVTLTAKPSAPAAGDSVTFTADTFVDDDLTVETYEWAIGQDADFSSGDKTREESFSDPGEHTVRLRITDSRDQTATATNTVQVQPKASGATMFQ